MAKLFGTDGIRGVFGDNLTCDLAQKVGAAFAKIVLDGGDDRPIIIGRDTRQSGWVLADAVAEGIGCGGLKVWNVGVVSTPGLCYLVNNEPVAGGVMISASHNPAEYNGLKLIGSDGCKLPDELEQRIEELVKADLPTAHLEGKRFNRSELVDKYIEFLVGCAPGRLDGLNACMDCANGSAYAIAPEVFSRLGAKVHAINVAPDGRNINSGCGSTHPESLVEVVREGDFQAGIAYDGDADRLLLVNEIGELISGDRILGAFVLEYLRQDRLTPKTVVGTIVSNLGLEHTLAEKGIAFYRSKVGDRHVLAAMLEHNSLLGGEPSGHVILSDYLMTGDGILNSVLFMGLLRTRQLALSEVAREIKEYPQFNGTAPATGQPWDASERMRQAVEIAKKALGDEGRIVIRPSGTEPVIRIMVEGVDERLVRAIGQELVGIMSQVASA